jgi:hypothetical protein
MTSDDLLLKYTELQALRSAVGQLTKSYATPRLRDLARRFPGALRELDRLPTPLLEERLEALQRGERSAPWMLLQCTFHDALSELLRQRRTQTPTVRRHALRENSYESALKKTAAALGSSIEVVRAALLGGASPWTAQDPESPPEGFAAPEEP